MNLTNLILVVEIAVCLLLTWPLVRQLSFAPFRYRLPCKTAQRIALLTGYVAFIGAIATFAPILLHVMATLAFGLLLFERWRARSDYGRARGLPPGSLAVMSRGHEYNAAYYESLIAKYGPIFKFSRDFRPYIYIYGHKRAIDFLRDNDDALIGFAQPISEAIPNGFVRYMPPAIHSNYRRILISGFTPEVIDNAIPLISSATRNVLKQISKDCGQSPTGSVVIDDYLRDLIFQIVLQVFFGVKPGTPMFDRISALYADIDTRTEICGAKLKRRKAMKEMTEMLGGQIESYAAERTSGPPCFLKAMAERNAVDSIDTTVLGNWAGMVEFATVDIVGLLQWLVKMLIDHPVWVNRVRQEQFTGLDHATATGGSVAERIVKETVRLERSEFLTRKATRDIRFEGHLIPKGWAIRIGIREGNRDPEVFHNPMEFNPDRFQERTFSLAEYAPFGLYRHNCIGSVFASSVGRIFVTELATGFDIESKGDWTTEYVPPHWRPRSGYRLGLTMRES